MSDTSVPLPVDQRLDLAGVTKSEFIKAMIHLYRVSRRLKRLAAGHPGPMVLRHPEEA